MIFNETDTEFEMECSDTETATGIQNASIPFNWHLLSSPILSSSSSSSSTPGYKRKTSLEIVDADYIEREIKKLKVFCSPGELRINNDLAMITSAHGLGTLFTIRKIEEMSVLILFIDAIFPSQFMVCVTSRYPHTPPSICIKNFSPRTNETVIAQNSEEFHSISIHILPNWSAIQGLQEMIAAISAFRLSYQRGEIRLEGGGAIPLSLNNPHFVGISEYCSVSDMYTA